MSSTRNALPSGSLKDPLTAQCAKHGRQLESRGSPLHLQRMSLHHSPLNNHHQWLPLSLLPAMRAPRTALLRIFLRVRSEGSRHQEELAIRIRVLPLIRPLREEVWEKAAVTSTAVPTVQPHKWVRWLHPLHQTHLINHWEWSGSRIPSWLEINWDLRRRNWRRKKRNWSSRWQLQHPPRESRHLLMALRTPIRLQRDNQSRRSRMTLRLWPTRELIQLQLLLQQLLLLRDRILWFWILLWWVLLQCLRH